MTSPDALVIELLEDGYQRGLRAAAAVCRGREQEIMRIKPSVLNDYQWHYLKGLSDCAAAIERLIDAGARNIANPHDDRAPASPDELGLCGLTSGDLKSLAFIARSHGFKRRWDKALAAMRLLLERAQPR